MERIEIKMNELNWNFIEPNKYWEAVKSNVIYVIGSVTVKDEKESVTYWNLQCIKHKIRKYFPCLKDAKEYANSHYNETYYKEYFRLYA